MMPKKKWKLNIINGTIHTGLSEIVSDSYTCGKRQIFDKDFTKEWVVYTISLASIAIAKESLFSIAIAKLTVNGPLHLNQNKARDKLSLPLLVPVPLSVNTSLDLSDWCPNQDIMGMHASFPRKNKNEKVTFWRDMNRNLLLFTSS